MNHRSHNCDGSFAGGQTGGGRGRGGGGGGDPTARMKSLIGRIPEAKAEFDKRVKLHSGDTLTITAQSDLSNAADISLCWKELI